MCYKIEATFILIHELKNKNSCTINELVKKKNLIENYIPSVFIDVSRNSIMNSITCFPEIFTWENNKITKKEKSNDFFCEPLIDFFDINIEKSVKSKITKMLEIGVER